MKLMSPFTIIREALKMKSLDKISCLVDDIGIRSKEIESCLGQIRLMIDDPNNTPSAKLLNDINKEKIAVAEAKKLNIPCFAMVDTNSDPNLVEFPIPANDDASKSIECIVEILTTAVAEGLTEKNKAMEEKAMENAKKAKAVKEKKESKEETTKTEK